MKKLALAQMLGMLWKVAKQNSTNLIKINFSRVYPSPAQLHLPSDLAGLLWKVILEIDAATV